MSAKVHIHLHVSDLARSREFYTRFFGADPVKEKPGYVKFLPDLGPVNLALSEARPAVVAGAVPEGRESRAESAGTTSPGEACAARCGDHFGVQVESPAVVVRELARVKAAGLPVREEMGVSCCHANQDKFWVEDPDGVEWEVYHLNYDLEEETAPIGLALVKTAGCCGS